MLGFTHTREWVYPQSIRGRFQTLRRWTFAALHLVLFVAPWITWGGHPLIRVDVPTRRTYLFGQIFTASDTLILVVVLFFLAFALFFFTALFGRIWCGYACPQTVFLETWIRPLELWIEGDRTQRKRRDAMGWTFDRAWRKAVKWTLFLLVAFVLSMAMMSIFAGARELWTGRAGPVDYTLVALLTGLWFWDFTWFREQFCNYLCPYARFQSALTDDESLLISYDEARGEPRGKGPAAAAEGRCIDCLKCVVVCPQGIDIRNGFQLECIQCARCVDACESVMSRLGHETLVRYSSVAEDAGRSVRRLRPRTLAYAAILVILAVSGLGMVVRHMPFEASVNRAPGTLFTVDADGAFRNTYVLSLINNDTDATAVDRFEVEVEGLEGAEVIVPEIELGATEARTVPLVVRLPARSDLPRTLPFRVRVTGPGGTLTLETTFKTGAAIHAPDSTR
ncbi:MAG: cytochrome c oxidase accessory protein CcoG [Gemmatimonadetes bacterium]|nr:MAG: cytochrome c oxidase accessory protein CcoG [Gemmatimonadota bacterium]